jgi:N-glycosylase/DNA lyase
MPKTIFIDTPPNFSFKATIYSHGWCELHPFEIDEVNWRLSYVFSDGAGKLTPAVISEENGRVRIDLANSTVDTATIERTARHLLRLDEDLAPFYQTLDGHAGLEWISQQAAGRMLRSATVFEDLVKTICTTNCSWALTKIMVTNLVEKLGAELRVPPLGGKFPKSSPPYEGGVADASSDGVVLSSGDDQAENHPTAKAAPLLRKEGSLIMFPTLNAFPTPAAMAAADEAFYRTEIKAGYRSPYFVELAHAVVNGELDPESWLDSELSTADLKKGMKRVKGVGDYAAENLLKLVGRYDGLALDSWLRSQFYKKHNKEKPCKDTKIHRHYKKFAPYQGLAIWCDMTEKWIA